MKPIGNLLRFSSSHNGTTFSCGPVFLKIQSEQYENSSRSLFYRHRLVIHVYIYIHIYIYTYIYIKGMCVVNENALICNSLSLDIYLYIHTYYGIYFKLSTVFFNQQFWRCFFHSNFFNPFPNNSLRQRRDVTDLSDVPKEYGPPPKRPWTAVGGYCSRRPENSVLRTGKVESRVPNYWAHLIMTRMRPGKLNKAWNLKIT